jgi:similar to stage IV sporulation protein
MMIRIQELAWISVNISGTRAKVEIVERVMPPKIIQKNIPCNIIATKNGLITSLIVKAGSPVVKVGDTVKKGDMIVASMIESEDKKDIRYVHAMADVTARTWYEEAANVDLERIVQKETGNACNKYEFELFNKLIGFGSRKVPYEYYNKQQIIKKISLGKDNILPFGIVINKYNEKKPYKEKISMDQARIQALKGVGVKLSEIIPKNAQVKDKKIYKAPCKSGIKVRMLVECLEEIGVQEKITY